MMISTATYNRSSSTSRHGRQSKYLRQLGSQQAHHTMHLLRMHGLVIDWLTTTKSGD